MTTHKPWGSYTLIIDEPRFKVKQIVVKGNQSISYQYHNKRSEIWYIKDGYGVLLYNDYESSVKSGDLLFIEQGAKHRITNSINEDLIIYELQYGELCEEEDICRIRDDYGRT